MRIGIMGGTFDPIHNAHLFLAEEARVQVPLNRVLFIPNRIPPHKSSEGLTSPKHRLQMVELAIASNPNFALSTIEIDREGPSYAVDTLRLLESQYPGAEFYFITGLDTVVELPTWHEPEELLRLCQVVGFPRAGFDCETALSALPESWLNRIIALDGPSLEISSTDLRRRIRENLPIRYLTPDSVVEYIAANELYR